MPNSDVTLGELARRLDSMHGDVRDLRAAVVEREDLTIVADAWKTALENHERHSAEQARGMQREIDQIRAWQVWAGRLVLGAVIAAIIAALLSNPAL